MFEELSDKVKILLGLGVSGLLTLIGYGLKNSVILQNQYDIIWSNDGWSYSYKWAGKRLIYPSQDIGNILIIIGVEVFIVVLIYINCLHYRKSNRKLRPKVLLCPS